MPPSPPAGLDGDAVLLLTHPDVGTLDLDDGTSYVTESLDLPLPVVRAVTDDRTEADGTFDQTRFMGARAVTAAVVCMAGPEGLQPVVDAVRAFLHPSLRPALVWECLGGGRRRITVRSASHDVTYEQPTYVATTLGFVAPGGLVESDDLHVVTIPAITSLDAQGRTYNLTFNRVYPASPPIFGSAVPNAGSAAVWTWKARLYGPCTDPQLENLTAGRTLAFTGLTLLRGQYVELDCARHTARIDSDPELSVYNRLDITASVWWPLLPGTNMVRYRAASAEEGAFAEIEYRDAWL